jgi:putative MATE family efflux protein
MRLYRWFSSPVSRELFALAYPLVLQSLAFTLFGLIDRLMVGGLQETAIAAVGLSGQALFFTITLAGALASACAILAAQYRGAGDQQGLATLSGTSLVLTGVTGLAFAVLLQSVAQPLLFWLSSRREPVVQSGLEYLFWVNLSTPAVLWTFVMTGIMRSLGDTRTPLIGSLVGLITNTGLNYLLIYGHAGFPRLEVKGAALATSISQALVFGITLVIFCRRTFSGYRFAPTHLQQFSPAMARQLCFLSVPIALDAFFWQAAALAYTKLVGLCGPQALPAYFMYLGLRGIGYIPAGALASAGAIMIGRYLGANHLRRAQLSTRRAVFLTLAISLGMSVFYRLITPSYLAFYQVEPAVAAMAGQLLFWFAVVFPCEGLIALLAQLLRAGGDALRVSLMTLASFWLVGIPCAWFFGVFLEWGLPGCFLSMCLESLCKVLLFWRRQATGAWLTRLVPPKRE